MSKKNIHEIDGASIVCLNNFSDIFKFLFYYNFAKIFNVGFKNVMINCISNLRIWPSKTPEIISEVIKKNWTIILGLCQN